MCGQGGWRSRRQTSSVISCPDIFQDRPVQASICTQYVLEPIITQFCVSAVQVVQGQTTDIFKRHPYPQLKAMSFSLLYKDDSEEGLRTLDITCKTEQEFELWFWGIQVSLLPSTRAGIQDYIH